MKIFRIIKKHIIKSVKKLLTTILPSYRVALRIERTIKQHQKKQDALFWYNIRENNECIEDTKKRFFLSLPPARGDLREAQLIILEILKKVDSICRENSLNYWLMGGSLIGAIRHRGFIPWDDDADIGMTRSDFIRLKELCVNNAQIEVIDYYNFNGKYRIPKVVLRNIDADFCIDIIVFDEINAHISQFETIWKKNRNIRKKLVNRMRLERYLYFNDFTHTQTLEHELKRKNRIDNIIDLAIKRCNYTLTGNTLVWGVDNFNSRAKNKARIFVKDSIFPCQELVFEDFSAMVPRQYSEFSKGEVGDFFSIPSDIGSQQHFKAEKLELHLNNIRNNQQRGN